MTKGKGEREGNELGDTLLTILAFCPYPGFKPQGPVRGGENRSNNQATALLIAHKALWDSFTLTSTALPFTHCALAMLAFALS